MRVFGVAKDGDMTTSSLIVMEYSEIGSLHKVSNHHQFHGFQDLDFFPNYHLLKQNYNILFNEFGEHNVMGFSFYTLQTYRH